MKKSFKSMSILFCFALILFSSCAANTKEKTEQEKREKYINEFIQNYGNDYIVFDLLDVESLGIAADSKFSETFRSFMKNIYMLENEEPFKIYYKKIDTDSEAMANKVIYVSYLYPAIRYNNPYGYEQNMYYFMNFADGNVLEWINNTSLFFNIDNQKRAYIYWDSESFFGYLGRESLSKLISDGALFDCLFLYEGVYEYKTVSGSIEIVPKFKMIYRECEYITDSELKKLAEESWKKEGKKKVTSNKEGNLVNNSYKNRSKNINKKRIRK